MHAQIKKKREESNIGLGKKYKGKTKNEDAKVLKNKNVEKVKVKLGMPDLHEYFKYLNFLFQKIYFFELI